MRSRACLSSSFSLSSSLTNSQEARLAEQGMIFSDARSEPDDCIDFRFLVAHSDTVRREPLKPRLRISRQIWVAL